MTEPKEEEETETVEPVSKKQKVEDEEDDDKEEQEEEDVVVKINKDGEKYFDISAKRRVTVRKFKSTILIDIREFYGDDESNLKPGKKGISLKKEQWNTILKNKDEINKIINSL